MSSLSNAKSALADAAERFDRLARVVKDQQLSETRSGQRVALGETYSASPEEAWAKKFMTQAIGPAAGTFTVPTVPPIAAFVPAGQAPLAMQGFVAASPPPVQAVEKGGLASASALRPGGDLRAAAGMKASTPKRARRRSWLGWLFLGR